MVRFIPEEKIEEIRSRVDIVDTVSTYVTLKKAGRNFLGLCPFHQEKTPSFTVSPEKQIFYCFGCQEGGHVFAFLMKIHGMTFPETVKYLAEKTGIQIPLAENRDDAPADLRSRILAANELAASFFRMSLASPAGIKAREYLDRRGIGEKGRGFFALGYAPSEGNKLRNYLEKKGISPETGVKAGLLIARDRDCYDRFRDRIIFPITDNRGKVVGFGGRCLDAGTPKYLNSPETPVYIKGRNLYGLFENREAIRKMDSVILVEGYFDVLSLWEAGFTNAVATLGTALTGDQVSLLKRFTRKVTVSFDGDLAGQKALRRSLELFLGHDMEARVLIFPPDQDPDSFVTKNGAENLRVLVDRAYPLVDYYIEEVIGKAGSFQDIREVTRGSVGVMAAIENPLEKDIFIRRVAERLSLNPQTIKREIQRLLPDKTEQKEVGDKSGQMKDLKEKSRKTLPAGDCGVELEVLKIMVEHPEKAPGVCGSGLLDCFENDELRIIGQRIAQLVPAPGGKPDLAGLMEMLGDSPWKTAILSRVIETPVGSDSEVDRVIEVIGVRLRQKWYRRKSQALSRELLKAEARGDSDECRRLLTEKNRLLAGVKAVS